MLHDTASALFGVAGLRVAATDQAAQQDYDTSGEASQEEAGQTDSKAAEDKGAQEETEQKASEQTAETMAGNEARQAAAGNLAGTTDPAADNTSDEPDNESCIPDDPGVTLGGESFTEGILVLLASDKAVPISSLKPGDKVEARDTKTGKNQAETVTAVLVHHDTNLYDVRVKTKAGTEVIDTTGSHLFYDPSAGKRVTAAKLKKGEPLQTPDGTTAVGGLRHAQGPRRRHGGLTVPGNDDHDF